jgi:sulfatase maturation enzyme AslB (radical SAM superfamily)
MSSETFKNMLNVSELLLENDDYDRFVFRLSGGEPLIVFDNYKDLVTRSIRKCGNKFNFCLLSSGTLFNEEILDWMQMNFVGCQISLDDMKDSKPLSNDKSSTRIVLKNNIEKFHKKGLSFSLNTVLDVNKTNSLNDIVDFVCSFPNMT